MKRGTVFLLIFVVVVILLAAAAVSILHDGLSARAKPTALETAIARTARKMAAPSGAHNQKNPVADSPEVQREARLHFADHCAICHGNDGSGDTMIGNGLYPKPPDLRADQTQKLSDGDIFWIIENGVRLTGMPAFGGAGSDHDHDIEDTWKLVHFIRHLPALTPAGKIGNGKVQSERPRRAPGRARGKRFPEWSPRKPPSKSEHASSLTDNPQGTADICYCPHATVRHSRAIQFAMAGGHLRDLSGSGRSAKDLNCTLSQGVLR